MPTYECQACFALVDASRVPKKCRECLSVGTMMREDGAVCARRVSASAAALAAELSDGDQFGPIDSAPAPTVATEECPKLDGETVPIPMVEASPVVAVIASEPSPDPEPPVIAAPPRKPHVSPSQLSMYFKCGEQYRRRYIEHERIPPGIAMHRGTGVHAGAQLNFRQKIASFVDAPTSEIVDAAVAAFDGAVTKDGVLLTREEESRGQKHVVAEARDTAARMARTFAEAIAPAYQPIEVEERVTIELPRAPRDILGIVDLVAVDAHDSPETGQRSVVDLKTGTKSRPQSDADDSMQLTVYSAAHHVRHGFPVRDARLEILIDGAKGVRRQTLTTTRDQHDIAAFVARVNAMLAGIEAGIFTPAPPGSWWCSARWCGYWSTCPYVNHHRSAGESFEA